MTNLLLKCQLTVTAYAMLNLLLIRAGLMFLDSLQIGDIKVIEGTVVGYTLFKVSVTDPVLY